MGGCCCVRRYSPSVNYRHVLWWMTFPTVASCGRFFLLSRVAVESLLLMAEFVAVGAGVVSAAATVWQAKNTSQKDKTKSSKDLETIHKDLNEAMKILCAIRDDHEDALKRCSARKRRTMTYNDWVEKVRKVEGEVDEINKKYERRSQKSKIKLKLDAGSKLRKEMENKSSDVVSLCDMGAQLRDILVEKEPAQIVKMNAPDIKKYLSLQNPLEEILDFLRIDKVQGIRIRGLVGTGKTTIMQNLNNHEMVVENFELVIWVNVSTEKNEKNLSVEQVQKNIVQRLKLNIGDASGVDEIAFTIREELRDKKYLLLLDDVKEDLEFDQIGIDLNNKNGSKIVLTTTVDGVCNSIVDRVVEVKPLTPPEAWKMFKNILSHSNHRDDQAIERIMVQIVDYCGGLPLVIKTVANAFKLRDSLQSWSNGFNSLRLWPEKRDDAMKALYKLLNFCSGQLNGAQKDCFFYSAIYPEDCDIHIDRLLDCWAAEDLCGDSTDAKHVRDYGPVILEDLKKVSLLEESARKEYVRMHKLIRRAALFHLSATGEYKHLVKTGESMQEPPDGEQWEQKKWISLVDNELETLPESPDCSMLSTLFLQENPYLRIMPNLFFEHMRNLRVFNADSTRIVSLPSSVSNLSSLKVLYLNGCTDLVVLPSQIGVLEKIEVLDMRGSGVVKIPPEIENLCLLRRLLVSFPSFGSNNDTQIVLHNCNTISKISKLEELVIDVRSYNQLGNDMQNVVIDKIAAKLTKLTTLKLCYEGGVEDDVIKLVAGTPVFRVDKADAFMCFVQRISRSKSFQVFIGCSSPTPPQIPNFRLYDRYLSYCNGQGSSATILKVLAKIEAFELVNHNELEHVSDFGTTSLDKIRGCLIEGCNKIKAIANKVDGPFLPNLEELYVKILPALESIWKGPVPLGSLNKLRTLKIEKCSQLKDLFSETGNGGLSLNFLRNLRMLILVDLPNLSRICAYESFEWPALEKLQIHACPNLIELPFNKDSATRLKSVEAEQSWWDTLQWQDPEVKEILQPSCSLG
ncbi:hypothetical protein LguiA_026119 [Lonicera macranthoides]